MTEDNERWKSDGDCSKCRRKNYCSKECTAYKRAEAEFITSAVRRITGLDTIESYLEDKIGRFE